MQAMVLEKARSPLIKLELPDPKPGPIGKAPYLALASRGHLLAVLITFDGSEVFVTATSSGKNKIVGSVRYSINISGLEPKIVILLPPISLVGTTTKLSA